MGILWSERSYIFHEDFALKRGPLPLHIIQDHTFRNGLAVYGARHEEDFVAQYAGVSETTGRQRWNVAQWALYNHPLTDKTPRLRRTDGGYAYETPSARIDVAVDDDYAVRLELRASAEYGGVPRVQGQAWPHLLLEQHDYVEGEPSLGELTALDYTAEVRMEYCRCNTPPEQLDPELHAAQFVHFFAIGDPVAGDMFWFGVIFFDSRHTVYPGYAQLDVGKDDCTNKMIVVEPLTAYTDEIPAMGTWLHCKADLLPLIKRAVETAQKRGTLPDSRFERMKILSTNIGFELPGDFDAALQIRKLELIAR